MVHLLVGEERSVARGSFNKNSVDGAVSEDSGRSVIQQSDGVNAFSRP